MNTIFPTEVGYMSIFTEKDIKHSREKRMMCILCKECCFIRERYVILGNKLSKSKCTCRFLFLCANGYFREIMPRHCGNAKMLY